MKEYKLYVGDIKESIKNVLTERLNDMILQDGYDQNADASADFDDSSFKMAINNRYPNKQFDFEVENDGTVIVTDINTGDYYIGNAELETENVPLRKPSLHNPYIEDEGYSSFYDFTKCLNTIMKKIDTNQPDGNSK